MIQYRLLTGKDNAEFCKKITQALKEGWQLYGNPCYSFNPQIAEMQCAQAVIKTVEDQ